MQKKSKTLLSLFMTMLKIGLFTFGGGYAMIALLESEFVEKKGWISKETFLDMTAIAGSAPGSIAINASTYIGYHLAGVAGSVTATIAVCIPSFVIIYLISLFFEAFMQFKFVMYAFRGIQVCVIYLIMSAGLKLFKTMEKKPLPLCIFGAVILCMVIFALTSVQVSTVLYILASGAVGVSAYLITRLVKKEKEGKQ